MTVTIVLLVIGYLGGAGVANLLLHVVYMDGEPSWLVKLVPLFWPVVLPAIVLWGIWNLLFMGWD